MFNQKEFNQFIIDQGIVGFFEEPITLVSGRTSSWYVNWRDVSADVYLIDKLSDFVLNFMSDQDIEFDCFFGTPDGATKLAVISQYKYALKQENYGAGSHVLSMGRKTPKDHGAAKDRFFVGAPKGKIISIEDVTTTGGSLLKSVQKLKELDFSVAATIALTNRNELMYDGRHVSDALKEIGVAYFQMSHAKELLPLMIESKKPSEKIVNSLREEYKKHGQFQLD